MKKNLDEAWKYTTKINIHPGERLVRESIYREGASDFQERLINALVARDPDDELTVELVRMLKP